MIPAYDEMRSAVILPDDSMPNRFSRPAHAHGQRKEAEDSHTIGITRQNGLVYPNAGEVVDIARLGQADDGMNEYICLSGTSGADGKLSMSAMHWIPCVISRTSQPKPRTWLAEDRVYRV